ncbi:DUF3999 family protein [Rhodanobacter sp. BL-MT-08]
MRREIWPIRRGLLAAVLLLLSGYAAALSTSDYAYRFALNTHGASAAWRVELTPAVYAVSNRAADLRDIVVVNAQGREVPFALLPPAVLPSHAYTLSTHLLPLPADSTNVAGNVRVQRSANGDIVIGQSTVGGATRPSQWLLDARRSVSLDSIEIDPSAFTQDLRIRLAVDASNDLQQWQTRSEDNAIVSLRRGGDAVEQRKIRVGGAPARYYRLRLIDGDSPWDSQQTPAVLLSGSLADASDDRAKSRQWLTVPSSPAAASASGATDYDFILPAALPIDAARVTLADANTAARFVLLDHDGSYDVPLTTMLAVQLGGSQAIDGGAVFDPVRVQRLRLHTDTPLSQPPTLAVGWHADAFVFLAEGAAPYSLLVGSHAARRGVYPVDAALARMRPAGSAMDWQPPLATLGARSDAGGAAALQPPAPSYDWSKMLLWLVLVGGALLVAWMALSLLKQSRRDNDRS